MKQNLQIRLLKTALQSIEAKQSDMGKQTTKTPVSWYISSKQLSIERTVLFRDFPLVVGFASQVKKPGDFITHSFTDTPILVVRDKENTLHAFLNLCRHRGTLLEDTDCGSYKKAFVCPYHAWTYTLSGDLQHVPHIDGFPEMEASRKHLIRLEVFERYGLIFVIPTPNEKGKTACNIDTFLGSFFQDFDSFGFQKHTLFLPSQRTIRANWKFLIDSSYETYHFRTVHAKTIYPMFLDNTGVFDWEEPHARMVLPKRSIQELPGQNHPSNWKIREYANILYGLFPNTLILVQPDHAMLISAWPIDVDHTLISGGMLIPALPKNEKQKNHWIRNEKIFWEAITEDLAMCEKMHRTLRAKPDRTLLFGRYEHLIAKYHHTLDMFLRRKPQKDPKEI